MSYDVGLFQTDSTGTLIQSMATTFNNGYKIEGKGKLAQRFIIELLTEKGSLTYLPNRGCNFVTLLRNSTSGTWDLIAAFSTSLLDIISNFSSEDEAYGVTDPEERLSAAELVNVTIRPGAISITIRIVNQAGESFNVMLPLSFTNL